MTKSGNGIELTVSEWAAISGKSLTTVYRQLRAGKLRSRKTVWGHWRIVLTRTEYRLLKRKFVNVENYASAEIRRIGFSARIDEVRARKEYARAALVALGAGDIVHAIDHAKIWRGREDKYGRNIYSRAMADIDRLVAA